MLQFSSCSTESSSTSDTDIRRSHVKLGISQGRKISNVILFISRLSHCPTQCQVWNKRKLSKEYLVKSVLEENGRNENSDWRSACLSGGFSTKEGSQEPSVTAWPAGQGSNQHGICSHGSWAGRAEQDLSPEQGHSWGWAGRDTGMSWN